MKAYLFSMLIAGCILSSCSTSYLVRIEKRRYMKGYHIETANALNSLDKVSKEKNDTVKKIEIEKELIVNGVEKTVEINKEVKVRNEEENSQNKDFQKRSVESSGLKLAKNVKKSLTHVALIKKEKIKNIGQKSNTAQVIKRKNIYEVLIENKGLLVLLVGLGLILLAIILASISIALWGVAGLFGGIGAVMVIVGLIVLLMNA